MPARGCSLLVDTALGLPCLFPALLPPCSRPQSGLGYLAWILAFLPCWPCACHHEPELRQVPFQTVHDLSPVLSLLPPPSLAPFILDLASGSSSNLPTFSEFLLPSFSCQKTLWLGLKGQVQFRKQNRLNLSDPLLNCLCSPAKNQLTSAPAEVCLQGRGL